MHRTYHSDKIQVEMFGVDIDGSSIMLNDNQSAVNKSSNIEYTLNNKHSSTAYPLDSYNVASGVVKIGWILKANNIADILKKVLIDAKRKKLFGDWNY